LKTILSVLAYLFDKVGFFFRWFSIFIFFII